METPSRPPTYEESLENNIEMLYKKNRIIFSKIRSVLDSSNDIEGSGITELEERYIQQLMKAFDKNYLYKNFDVDYEYIITKLSLVITTTNNYALREINESLQPDK